MTKKAKKITEFLGTGRRKTSIASVRIRPGSGKITVNDREFENYLPLTVQRERVLAPLDTCGVAGKYDILMRVKGGGIQGQVDAMRLGIARALNLENDERQHDLRVNGYLTRDPRKKERKKYGLAGARKRFQFSKR